ncbi:MAG: TlpA family protein disulfide reductase [Saprospiraceae bacterium]|nr:TlpA family protein disulfide reductase [Saprospiraceae bacterium]
MNKNTRKELLRWALIALIALVLYLTGLHVPVIGFLQRGLLATGLIRPAVELPVNGSHTTFPQVNLDIQLESADGQVLNMKQFQGKVLFINLWATWCPPCLAEMPNLNHLYNDLSDEDIQFLMIATDQDFSKATDFVHQKGYHFPIYRIHHDWPKALDSSTLPTTFVIDKQGRIVLDHRGMAQYNTKKFKAFLLGLN